MKKRFLTILIAAALCCTMAFPAVAVEYDSSEGMQVLSETEELPETDYEEAEDDSVGFEKEPETEESEGTEALDDIPSETEETGESEEAEVSDVEADMEADVDEISAYDSDDSDDSDTDTEEEPEEENEIELLSVLNGFGQDSDGEWYYYVDGQIAADVNSVIQDAERQIDDTASWWYVVSGKVQMGFTGLADYSNSNGWWYINDGKVTFDVETVAHNRNGWFYVKDSKVQFGYSGFADNSNGWWYIENGKVTFNKNSVIQDSERKVDGTNSWWYVVESKVQKTFTGLADYSNNNGWWYINDGKVTFNVETVAQNKNGWFYVKDSKVQFSYNGFADNSNGWWYIENGKVTFNKNSVILDSGKKVDGTSSWWYVVGSKVQKTFTGLADYSNSNGWWYIESGKVTFTKDTIAKNKNGWYYVKDSKVDFSFTGLADFPNENGWWYLENGKVTFTKETVAKNKNGWYYIKDSKVDFNYNGIAQNSNGWWYISSGKVDFSAGDYSFAANTSQIIDVRASGTRGTLTLYDKNGGSFTQKLSTSCYLGRNGITSNKSEGDGKTPSGVYTLGQAFGVASDPGSTRSYLKLTSNYYWVDDSTSKYYNQLVDISKVTKDWSSAEHLIDYTSAYKYAIAINYNTACTPYKGSAIFLHCSTGSTTSGCVAVSESNMIKILQSLKSDTRIYIH